MFDNDFEVKGGVTSGTCKYIDKQKFQDDFYPSFVEPCAKGINYLTDLKAYPRFNINDSCKYLSYRLYSEVTNKKKFSS